MPTIDLNADVGEECGHDAELLEVVSSANIAAGAHAGGGPVLDATVRLARDAGVAIGAHPSYPDRAGFGRVSMAADLTIADITRSVASQVFAVMDACTRADAPMRHVKAHGALYHDAGQRRDVADAFLDGVHAAVGPLPVVGMPGTHVQRACAERGIPYVVEGFADRAYAADGSLVPRAHPAAVITDPDLVAARVIRLVGAGEVVAVDGECLRLAPDTICLHGDTVGAVRIARVIRTRLIDAGVAVTSVIA